jgi:hypothetical protein
MPDIKAINEENPFDIAGVLHFTNVAGSSLKNGKYYCRGIG